MDNLLSSNTKDHDASLMKILDVLCKDPKLCKLYIIIQSPKSKISDIEMTYDVIPYMHA